MRLELIDRNVASLVRAPRHDREEFTVWDIEEALAFLRAAESDRFHAFWVLWLTMGARPDADGAPDATAYAIRNRGAA